jgi:hypothetical protein
MTDWIEDPDLTPEQKLQRFEELGPEVTTGPLIGGAVIMTPSPTYGPDAWEATSPSSVGTVAILEVAPSGA